VPHGVAEIQDAPQVALAFVGGHDLGFDPHRIRDDSIDQRRLLREHRFGGIVQHPEQIRIANDAALDDFVKARAILALRQRSQQVGIDQHDEWLVKAPHQILARDQIHSGLAAYRGVDLRQQRRGNLNQRHAAHENRGEESADVIDDAATEGDHDARTIGAGGRHFLGETLDFRQALVAFATRKKQ